MADDNELSQSRQRNARRILEASSSTSGGLARTLGEWLPIVESAAGVLATDPTLMASLKFLGAVAGTDKVLDQLDVVDAKLDLVLSEPLESGLHRLREASFTSNAERRREHLAHAESSLIKAKSFATSPAESVAVVFWHAVTLTALGESSAAQRHLERGWKSASRELVRNAQVAPTARVAIKPKDSSTLEQLRPFMLLGTVPGLAYLAWKKASKSSESRTALEQIQQLIPPTNAVAALHAIVAPGRSPLPLFELARSSTYEGGELVAMDGPWTA